MAALPCSDNSVTRSKMASGNSSIAARPLFQVEFQILQMFPFKSIAIKEIKNSREDIVSFVKQSQLVEGFAFQHERVVLFALSVLVHLVDNRDPVLGRRGVIQTCVQ